MNIEILASSSKGNCYWVSASGSGSPILLECGLPFPEIRRLLGFRVSELAGCLLSHEHGDHAKAAKDILRAGVDCYCSKGTAEALGLEGHRLRVVKAKIGFTIGAWSVIPFDTVHDAAEPLGFLLTTGSERLLFATDTAYIRYRFAGLTHIMCECNYDLPVLKAHVKSGLVPPEVKRRVLHSHMNLDTIKGFLRATDLRQVREIVLMHLSADNSDAERFGREIRALTGRPVRIG